MILDLSFPVYGDAPLPADHGFLLYAGLVEKFPQLRLTSDIAVHPLTGRYVGDRLLILMPFSDLALRLPDTQIGEFLALSRNELSIGCQTVRVGVPRVHRLQPSSTLTSRLVTFDGCHTEEAFGAELHYRLSHLGIESPATATLVARRSLKTTGRELIGYGVELSGLMESDSLRVQENRAGARSPGFEHCGLGCGVFVPGRGNAANQTDEAE